MGKHGKNLQYYMHFHRTLNICVLHLSVQTFLLSTVLLHFSCFMPLSVADYSRVGIQCWLIMYMFYRRRNQHIKCSENKKSFKYIFFKKIQHTWIKWLLIRLFSNECFFYNWVFYISDTWNRMITDWLSNKKEKSFEYIKLEMILSTNITKLGIYL